VNRRIDEMELNEEILIKLSNQLHINNDDPSEMEFIENKELLQRILLSMEVMVQKNEAPPVIEIEENTDDKPAPKAFDLKKIKLIVDQDSDISSIFETLILN
jgi:DNA-binding helix-hairpin-helix protein with protein kinase domain